MSDLAPVLQGFFTDKLMRQRQAPGRAAAAAFGDEAEQSCSRAITVITVV